MKNKIGEPLKSGDCPKCGTHWVNKQPWAIYCSLKCERSEKNRRWRLNHAEENKERLKKYYLKRKLMSSD